MIAIVIASIALVIWVTGAWVGMWLQRMLHQQPVHLTDQVLLTALRVQNIARQAEADMVKASRGAASSQEAAS